MYTYTCLTKVLLYCKYIQPYEGYGSLFAQINLGEMWSNNDKGGGVEWEAKGLLLDTCLYEPSGQEFLYTLGGGGGGGGV